MRRMMFLALMMVLTCSPAANADIITYQYVTDIATNGQVLNYSVGQDVAVNIYLQEANGSLISNQGGLAGFAVSLARTSGTSTAIDTTQGTINRAIWDVPTIDNQSKHLTAALAEFYGGVSGANPNPIGGRIQLATVHLIVGAGTTTFNIGSDNFVNAIWGGGNTLTGTGLDLDLASHTSPAYSGTENASNAFSFSINGSASVPEPSSMVLCGLAVAGLAARTWRRRAVAAAARSTSC